MWLPAYLKDVESDLSAFHRVDDIGDLSAPRFFALAWRTPHYRGVMRDRVLALQREDGEPRPVSRARQAQPVTRAALADPVMSMIFDFG